MSPQAKQAHLRLLSILPRRTHEWQPITIEWGYKRTASESTTLKSEMQEMRDRGASNKELVEKFRCTNNTILKLIGPTARGRSRLAR